jgi:hypothetical protein
MMTHQHQIQIQSFNFFIVKEEANGQTNKKQQQIIGWLPRSK